MKTAMWCRRRSEPISRKRSKHIMMKLKRRGALLLAAALLLGLLTG